MSKKKCQTPESCQEQVKETLKNVMEAGCDQIMVVGLIGGKLLLGWHIENVEVAKRMHISLADAVLETFKQRDEEGPGSDGVVH